MRKSLVKRLRLWFLLLIPIVIVCAAVSSAHIHDVGRTFTRAFPELQGEALSPEDFTFDPAGMAAVESISADSSGVPLVTFAVGEDSGGWGQATVNGESGGEAFVMEARDGVLIVDGIDFSGWEAVFASVIIVVAAVFALCLVSFARLLRRAWFGYEMAVYAGMALFFGVQAASFIAAGASGEIASFGALAFTLVTMADNFVFVSLIPMIALALLVTVSNVILIRRNGIRPSNMFGIAASLAWATACLAWWVVNTATPESFELFVALLFVDSMVAAAISYVVCLLAGVALVALLAARHSPSVPQGHLIILGCRIAADGTPMSLLAGRIDAALAFARRQEEAGCEGPVFVPSGGKGPDEPCSEAESIGRYLEERGIPAGRILLEDKSKNTRQNMEFSAKAIAEGAPRAKGMPSPEGPVGPGGGEGEGLPAAGAVAFATSSYHVLRGYVHAHRAGMDAEGVGAPTSFCYWPNAFLREFVGMLAGRALPILVALAVIEALYLIAEYALLLA